MTYKTPSLQHAPRHLWPWLILPASLTAALQRAYGGAHRVRAQVLGSGRRRPSYSERQILSLHRGERIFWREVLLHAGDPQRPAIWAMTSIPLSGLRHGLLPLARHGSRPIGNTLFRHRRLRRSPITMNAAPRFGQRVWQRRSILRRGQSKVLVEEHFLPDLPRWAGRGRR
ncbi:chorismate--pyruvate lyase family protein [Acidithiobacillus sp. M4-SHS-6]|uniref:chorismate--pyruvate lyase family protein n=1 Tax=Acidithiobacillus sp. M4-SHS-6 TaxID=3383024 RepID=UPI0039BE0FC4